MLDELSARGIRMSGARLIDLEPPDCLFIDDYPDLVAAARALGYHGPPSTAPP